MIKSSITSNLILIAITPVFTEKIAEIVKLWCDDIKVDLVLSSGGTGFGIRDHTPEAIRPLLHREAPGVAQALISEGAPCHPYEDLPLSVALAPYSDMTRSYVTWS